MRKKSRDKERRRKKKEREQEISSPGSSVNPVGDLIPGSSADPVHRDVYPGSSVPPDDAMSWVLGTVPRLKAGSLH